MQRGHELQVVAANEAESPPDVSATDARPLAKLSAVSASETSTSPAVSGETPPSGLNPPALRPTRQGPLGIRYDFNRGMRVELPEGKWRIQFRDTVADCVVYNVEVEVEAGTSKCWSSLKRYYVPFELTVWKGKEEVFKHRMDLRDEKVLIQFPVGTLGDSLGWAPYAEKFLHKHGCRLTCSMGQPIIDLIEKNYPEIEFVTPDKVKPEDFYATYNIGLFFTDEQCNDQPYDHRFVGLHRTAGHILGVDPTEVPLRLHLPEADTRPIPEKYVVIATKATTQAKMWNHRDGWREIVKFLKEHGYRVICIDREAATGQGYVWNQIPHGCEDETGDRPLAERARWIKHADFFIGMSSGLSWLAWATGTPVVLISGFSHPTTEFHTPYRVINLHACNGCWNDPKLLFDHHDFLWCPRHKGTPRQFECTGLISPGQVKATIQTIPGFAA